MGWNMDRTVTFTRRTILQVGAVALAAFGVGLLAACGSSGTAGTAAPTVGAASPVAGATVASGATSAAPTRAPGAAPTSSLSATAQPGAARPTSANAVSVWYGQDYIPDTTDTMKMQLDDFSKQKNTPMD